MKNFVAWFVTNFLPSFAHFFAPAAPNGYALTDAQTAVLRQHDVHRLELRVFRHSILPVQVSYWGHYRSEDFATSRNVLNDLLFIRRKGETYELRMGAQYSRQSPQQISGVVDILIETAISQIEYSFWCQRTP